MTNGKRLARVRGNISKAGQIAGNLANHIHITIGSIDI